MAKSKFRLFIVVLLLTVSLGLLIWGLWPMLHLSRTLLIPPGDLQLPTPGGFLPGPWSAG